MIENEKISAEDQKQYGSGVNTSLFLVKHSTPDIANTTRELFKANEDANPLAF